LCGCRETAVARLPSALEADAPVFELACAGIRALAATTRKRLAKIDYGKTTFYNLSVVNERISDYSPVDG
jgi:hypothetical protein